MRRFWQINTIDVFNHDEINSISYLDIWKSVDPFEPSPIKLHLTDIRKLQHRELRNMYPLEEYLTNHCDPMPEDQFSNWMSDVTLYNNFKSWLEWQNLDKFTPTINKFLNSFRQFIKSEAGVLTTYEVNGRVYLKKRNEEGIKYGVKLRYIAADGFGAVFDNRRTISRRIQVRHFW